MNPNAWVTVGWLADRLRTVATNTSDYTAAAVLEALADELQEPTK